MGLLVGSTGCLSAAKFRKAIWISSFPSTGRGHRRVWPVPSHMERVFPEVSELFGKTFRGQLVNNANDLSMLILEKAHVATVPGDAFGYPECIRISYSASREQIKEAIIRIKDLLS